MKIRRIFSEISWQEVILLFAIMVVGLPSLFVDWMIVDDGVSILISENISKFLAEFNFTGLADIFLENEAGRFRPAYWLFQWITYLIAGKSAFFHHLIRFFISSSTVVLIYLIIKDLTKLKTAALIGSLLFILPPFNIENWYRLGPQEPIMSIYLAISLFCVIKILHPIILTGRENVSLRRFYFIFSFICLILSFLIKEVSLALLPFFIFLLTGVYVLKRKEDKKSWIRSLTPFVVLNLIMFLVVLTSSLLIKQNYSSNYNFSLITSIDNGRWYLISVIAKTFAPFLIIFLLSFIYNLIICLKERSLDKARFFQLAFIVGFISFLLIQLPWDIPMGRYLEPALIFFVLIYGIEASYILRLGYQRVQILIFSLAFLFLLITGGFTILNYARDVIMGQAKIAQTLSYIASETPANTKIFWNLENDESTKELIFESNLHLALFYKRPDLKIEYLGDQVVGKLAKGDLVMTIVDSKNLILYKEDELAREERLSVVKVIPHTVVRYFFHPLSGLKSVGNKLFGFSYPVHDLLETTIIKSRWTIYKVNS